MQPEFTVKEYTVPIDIGSAKVTKYVSLSTPSKRSLAGYVEGAYNVTRVTPPYLQITTMCCGRVFRYETYEDVPEESVPCDCAPNRWAIFYTGEELPGARPLLKR